MTDYTELVKALRYCEFGWSARTCDNCEYSKTDCTLLLRDAAADAIEALQAEVPKRGVWVEESYNNQHNLYRCSVCGLEMLTNPDYAKKHKYCFACGAKMEVQE